MIQASSTTASMLAALSQKPAGAKTCRTLAATRFVDFPNNEGDKDWRRRTASAIRDGAALPRKLSDWQAFALALAGNDLKSPCLLFASQQSRLMVNMGGSVFENGGLCLDRISGIPFIPGSATKACARRTALATLRERCTGILSLPGATAAANSDDTAMNPLVAAAEAFATNEDFLFAISLIFGWSDLEWKGREDFRSDDEWKKKRPDFAWACDQSWNAIRSTVATRLCAHLHITPEKAHQPWESLPHFAGTIAFLPAYPWEKDPGIDLDVITAHHREYHENPDRDAIATDTEDPVPVIFPAVAPGQTWAFLLTRTRRAHSEHITYARTWLRVGLETLGIGAKTNAGYGWFEDVTARMAEAAEVQRKAEEAKTRLASAQADSSIADNLRAKPKDQLRGILNKFEFDSERFWPQEAPECTPEFQLTLLELHLNDPSLLGEALMVKKAKKALQNLAKKFNRPIP
jgi:CRISPR type III-B/RAMP module RAMP protein Cmr6